MNICLGFFYWGRWQEALTPLERGRGSVIVVPKNRDSFTSTNSYEFNSCHSAMQKYKKLAVPQGHIDFFIPWWSRRDTFPTFFGFCSRNQSVCERTLRITNFHAKIGKDFAGSFKTILFEKLHLLRLEFLRCLNKLTACITLYCLPSDG